MSLSSFFSRLFGHGGVKLPTGAPTFVDTFVNLDNWIVSTWTAPQNGIAQVSSFQADHVAINVGFPGLSLILDQLLLPNTTVQSIGGEVQSKQKFGYGVYEWIAMAGGNVNGLSVAGGVTGLFNFINNSETEIDFEVEGQSPTLVDLTNYSGITQATTGKYTTIDLTKTWHSYKFFWTAKQITWFLDGKQIRQATLNIPTVPAFVMMNHWGTNNRNFGGLATPGVSRSMHVQRFSFTPA